MRRAQSGDASAYRLLLTDLRQWLLFYFRRRLRGADIEDLVQTTLLTVHEKRHTYDPAAPLAPWLYAVARHKLIDHVRRNRHVHIEIDDALVDERGGDPLAAALAREDLKVLMSSLPKDQARALHLHKVGGLSVEEVAGVTGHSAGNVKVLMHRAMKRLKLAVDPEGRP